MIPYTRLQQISSWVNLASSSGDTPEWKRCHEALTSVRTKVYLPFLEIFKVEDSIKALCFARRCSPREILKMESNVFYTTGISLQEWNPAKLPEKHRNLLTGIWREIREISETEPVFCLESNLLRALLIWQECPKNRCRVDIADSHFRYLESRRTNWKEKIGLS